MKISVLLVIAILNLLLFACNNKSENNASNNYQENNSKIEIVQVQFGPSFISPSMLTYNMLNDKILFQRIGMRNKLKVLPIENGGKVLEVFSPKTQYFTIDSLNSIFVKDSILSTFKSIDYVDMNLACDDGIFTSLIFTFDNNSIIDIELDNNYTENQHKLILKLLELCILNETDSLNLDYLEQLKKYY